MDESLRNIKFYQFNETVLHPFSVSFTLMMCVLILFVNRKNVLIPLFAVSLYIPSIQRIIVGGLDFDMLRIITLFAFGRMFIKREHRGFQFNIFDKAMIVYILFNIVAYTALRGTPAAFINRLGFTYTVLGFYFLCRIYITSLEDLANLIKVLVIISAPLALEMLYEQASGKNLFSGMHRLSAIMIREDRFRAQAAFSHPILAGCFGASLLPFAWYFWNRAGSYRKYGMLCLTVSTIITLASASSGPVLSYVAGIFAIILWRIRAYVKWLVYGGLLSMIGLHLVMKAPVWALIWRVSVVAGSTGYHRYTLIDQAIKRFPEWWLMGSRNMGSWAWGLQDVTNQYVRIGTNGGAAALFIFFYLIYRSFREGAYVVNHTDAPPVEKVFVWALMCSLFTIIVSYMGVAYFGQMVLYTYFPFAIFSNVKTFFDPATNGSG